MLIVAWLSSRNNTGSCSCRPISSRHDRIHINALHAVVMARYSAADEDCAGTPGCSLQPKYMGSPFRKMKKPSLLLRVSGHEPWPASTHTVARIFSPSLQPLLRMTKPQCLCPPAYCHACVVASKCGMPHIELCCARMLFVQHKSGRVRRK